MVGRVFISDNNATEQPTVWKNPVIVSDNDATERPTVWKKASLVSDTVGDQVGSVFHPDCVVPVASFTADVVSGFFPLTVTFTDTSTDSPSSWLWDFGDGDTSTLQNPTHEYSSIGVYTVILIATNDCGSDTSAGTVVTVLDGNVLFDDTFTGAAGTIVSHTPDIAPVGFVWRTHLGAGLILTGDGRVESSDNNDSGADSNNSIPAFTLPLAYPYVIRLDVEMPPTPAAVAETAAAYLYDGVLFILFGINSGTGFRNIYFNNFSGQSLSVALPSVGNYIAELRVVNASTVELYLDGVLVGSRSVGFGILTPNRLVLQVSAEVSARYRASRLRIRNE